MLRSPVDRTYSHYLHNYYAGLETDPLDVALRERPLYIQASLYFSQIEQYLKYFPRENLQVILLEDLRDNSLETVQKVFAFIGAEAAFVPPNINERKHQTGAKRGKDNVLMKGLRIMPFYHQLSSTASDRAKSIASLLLKRKAELPPPLSANQARYIAERVASDIEKTSEFLGRDLSFWNLNKNKAG